MGPFAANIAPLLLLRSLSVGTSPLNLPSLFFHANRQSPKKNSESLQSHILSELNVHFGLIAVTETRINNENLDFNRAIPNYNFEFVPTRYSTTGKSVYLLGDQYSPVPDLQLCPTIISKLLTTPCLFTKY